MYDPINHIGCTTENINFTETYLMIIGIILTIICLIILWRKQNGVK